jgi:hypothetical protein
MKIKRVTFEVELPFDCTAEIPVMLALRSVFSSIGIPMQAQVTQVEVSPNTQIGDVTTWPPRE